VLLPVIALLCAQADVEVVNLHAELERRCQDPEQAEHLVCDDVGDEELNLDYPLEARPDTPEARTSARLHADVGVGAFISAGSTAEGGPQIAVGKPLFLFSRHRHFQGSIDSRFAVQLPVNMRHVALTLTPLMGINWYFGRYVGLEVRAGVGFGSDLAAQVSRFGVAISMSGAIVVRPFSDDRQRLKLGVAIDEYYLVSVSPLVLAGMAGLVLGFELPVGG